MECNVFLIPFKRWIHLIIVLFEPVINFFLIDNYYFIFKVKLNYLFNLYVNYNFLYEVFYVINFNVFSYLKSDSYNYLFYNNSFKYKVYSNIYINILFYFSWKITKNKKYSSLNTYRTDRCRKNFFSHF